MSLQCALLCVCTCKKIDGLALFGHNKHIKYIFFYQRDFLNSLLSYFHCTLSPPILLCALYEGPLNFCDPICWFLSPITNKGVTLTLHTFVTRLRISLHRQAAVPQAIQH